MSLEREQHIYKFDLGLQQHDKPVENFRLLSNVSYPCGKNSNTFKIKHFK